MKLTIHEADDCRILDERGLTVAMVCNSDTAAKIVRECNASDLLITALRTILELASNAPGRDVFAKIATEALAAAEAA